MELINVPASFPLYWGQNAGGSYIRNIPVNSQIGITNGAASLSDGFPPDTFQPAGAGGVPPFGQDFNGILRQLSQWAQWLNAGAPVVYNSAFSASAAGYPAGATLRAASLPVNWISLVDANTSDPDTGGANWIAQGGGVATIASASTVDLSTTWAKVVTVTGTVSVTALGTLPAGVVKVLVFGGVLTLTYNATSLILPGAANITTAAGDVAVVESLGSGNWKCIVYQTASGQALVPAAAGSIANSQLANMAAGTMKGNAGNSAAAPSDLTGTQARLIPGITTSGYLFGLSLSNDAGTPNTVLDIAAGEAASSNSGPTILALATAFTKKINTAWAAGTGNGALDAGSFVNTTYHIFVIGGPTVTTDVLASASATSPTLPANYTLFRRIGSIVVQSGAILAFVQTGDDFYWNTSSPPSGELSGSGLKTVTVPLGIRVKAHFTANIGISTGSGSVTVEDGANTNIRVTHTTDNNTITSTSIDQYTNTSAQVGVSSSNLQGSSTLGYTDTRGK